MKILFENETFSIEQFPQPEQIHHAKDFKCLCGEIDFLTVGVAPVGYCSTDSGYMAVFECPHCFEKSRFHIQTTGRHDLENFKQEAGLMLHLHKHRSSRHKSDQ